MERAFGMELGEKLQKMRKQKGITQEQLADSLFVSRAAVSKWESGRGYPNIDSLKAIAQFFGVTIDELLREDAYPEVDEKEKAFSTKPFFAWFDIAAVLLLLLPIFGQAADGAVRSIPLLMVESSFMKTAYIAAAGANIIWGMFSLALRVSRPGYLAPVSLLLSIGLLLLFILGRQPYAAVFSLSLLIAKVLWAVKRR